MTENEIGWTIMGIVLVFGTLLGFAIAAWFYDRRIDTLRYERDGARQTAQHYQIAYDQSANRLAAATRAFENLQARMGGMLERDPATGRMRKARVTL